MQPQLVGPVRNLIEKVVEQRIDAVFRRTAGHGVQIDRQADHIAAELLDLLKVSPAKLGKMHVLRTGRLQPIGQIDAPAERNLGTPRSGGPTQKHETSFSHYLILSPANSIGNARSSRFRGSSTYPKASRVTIPKRLLSPGSPKITGAAPRCSL